MQAHKDTLKSILTAYCGLLKEAEAVNMHQEIGQVLGTDASIAAIAALEGLIEKDSSPATHKLVPLEPDLEMVMAGEHAASAQLDVRLTVTRRKAWPSEEAAELVQRVAYRAMVAKAP